MILFDLFVATPSGSTRKNKTVETILHHRMAVVREEVKKKQRSNPLGGAYFSFHFA